MIGRGRDPSPIGVHPAASGRTGDVRSIGIGVLAALSTFQPNFLFRYGALLVLLLAVPDLRLRKLGSADLWVLGFAVLTLASLQWSRSLELTTLTALNQVAVTIVFVSVRMTIVSVRRMTIVAAGYLAGCLASVWLLFRDNAAALTLNFDSLNDDAITGLNANYTAYALAAGIGVAALTATMYRKLWWLLLVVALAAYSGIVLTGCRGALVAAIMTTIWWLLPARLKPIGIWVVYSGISVVAIGILTGWSDALLRSQVNATNGRDTGDLNGRLSIWPIARGVFSDHPVLGAGSGTFPSLNPTGIAAHSVMLDVATGLGAVGLAAMGAVIWTTLFTSTRRTAPDTRRVLLGTAICCLAAPMLTGYWYQAPAAWMVLAIFSRMDVIARLTEARPAKKHVQLHVQGRP